MDIHRSRFVAFPSSPINALAFSRSSDKGLSEPKAALKLAIGRANGDIEIWNPFKGDWVQEVVFPGAEKRSIDGLVWTQEPDDTDYEGKAIIGELRLFSIGSTAAVTEWNLGTGRPLRASTGNFSEVWCCAAQPRWKAGKTSLTKADDEFRGQNLVAGCGDGTLAILSTADNDLVFQRFLARSGSRKTRCMSVTWQSRDRIVAGFSDSNIRIYDARNGSLLRNMSLGAGIPGAPRDTLVWRLKCLPNADIVSADSNGEVRFWDGRNYGLMQRVSGHESDCLEIVTSSDGQVVFSGGMDGKIATYRLGGREGEKRRWAKTSHRRMHEGDIKSMAVYDSKAMSVVVSGGLDAAPAIIPLRAYTKELHRKVSGLPQCPPCTSAPDQRLLVSWWDRQVYIWRIGTQRADQFDMEAKSRKLVSCITIKGTESISSVAISRNGSVLSVATAESVKVFQLRPSRDDSDDRLRVRTLELPKTLAKEGARLVQISPDARWLSIVTPTSEVKIARIAPTTTNANKLEVLDTDVELERQNRRLSHQSGLKRYERTVTRVAFSDDSSVLVAGDLCGYLDSWVLEGHYDPTAPAIDKAARDSSADASSGSDSDSDSSDEDNETTIFYGQHWAPNTSNAMLPRLDSAPLVLSFRPSSPSRSDHVTGNPGLHPTRHNPHAHSHAKPSARPRLLVITQHHKVYEFDVLAGKLTDWSRRNPSSVLPPELGSIKDRVMGVVWDDGSARSISGGEGKKQTSESHERVWLYGSSWLAMLDVSQDFDVPRLPANEKTTTDTAEVDEDALEDTTNALVTLPSTDAAAAKKRKRGVEADKWQAREEKRRRVKGRGGAGDRVHESEKGGVVSAGRRIDENGVSRDVDFDAVEAGAAARNEDSEDEGGDEDIDVDVDVDMDVDGEGTQAPLALRRAPVPSASEAKSEDGNNSDDDEDEVVNDRGSRSVITSGRGRKWWCTYKYRPILGVCAIAGKRGETGGGRPNNTGDVVGTDEVQGAKDDGDDGAVEVVLVERPPWDLEQVRALHGR